jgi:hypothetical protein
LLVKSLLKVYYDDEASVVLSFGDCLPIRTMSNSGFAVFSIGGFVLLLRYLVVISLVMSA